MLAKRVLLGLLFFKGTAMIFSYLWHCQDYSGAKGNEDSAILAKIMSSNQKTIYYHRLARAHDHAIPNVLVFTHYINLLEMETKVNSTTEEEQELRVLQHNIRATIALHPNATVRFLTDADCERSIRTVLGRNTRLLEYFRRETQGMYKSDICRGAALFETGGLYFDVDLGVRMSLWSVLGEFTSFVTVNVHEKSKQRPGFFQAFMGATPRHPIIRRYLELFVKYYDGELKLETRLLSEHKHMLGVRILRIAYDQRLEEEEKITEQQLRQNNNELPESLERSLGDGSTSPRPTFQKIGPVELWQETLFSQQKFPLIPEPTWGSEKSCKYVVVANKGWPPVVPFYSRVEGSRMCPHNAKKTDDNTFRWLGLLSAISCERGLLG